MKLFVERKIHEEIMWPYTWSLFASMPLRTWFKRERWIVLHGQLSNAFSHCICTGRFGALWFLFFPASSWIPSHCCLDPLLLPWAYHLDPMFIPHWLLGWVSQFDRVLLGRTRQQERGLYIPHQAPGTERSSSISSSIPQEKSQETSLSLGKS